MWLMCLFLCLSVCSSAFMCLSFCFSSSLVLLQILDPTPHRQLKPMKIEEPFGCVCVFFPTLLYSKVMCAPQHVVHVGLIGRGLWWKCNPISMLYAQKLLVRNGEMWKRSMPPSLQRWRSQKASAATVCSAPAAVVLISSASSAMSCQKAAKSAAPAHALQA